MVVLDPDGRLLLFRYDDPPPMGVHWLTPGGGVDPGETPREAAARELREETGWTDVAVGPQLGTGARRIDKPPAPVLQHETHFLARVSVARRPVDVAGHEADSIAGWRWFGPDELASEPHRVWPAELPAYLRRLAARPGGAVSFSRVE